jgi:hypothetical protein
MVMKKMFLLTAIVGLLFIGNQSLTAQDEFVAGKLFYGEFCGPGIVMSVNYDARFKSNTRLGLGYRIGAGFGYEGFEDRLAEFMKKLLLDRSNADLSDFEGYRRTIYSFPVGLNYVFGKQGRASSFEAGAGATFLPRKASLYNYEIEKQGHVIGYLTFMYRLAPVNGGISVRIGFTPIIGTAGDFYPMAAIGFGYAFY